MNIPMLLRRFTLLSLFAAFAARADMANDPRGFLLRGMEKYAFPPVSDTICSFGNEMLPVISTGPATQLQAVVVAGEYGKGRFVAYGSRAFLDGSLDAQGDNMVMLKSALWWASNHKVGKNKAGFVGVLNLPPKITDYLQAAGFSAQETTLTDLEGLQAVIGDFSNLKDSEVEILRTLVEGGGGLVIAGDATQWVKTNPDRSVTLDYPPNKLMSARGCFWNGVPVNCPPEAVKPAASTELLHGRDALNVAIRIADGREKPDQQTRLMVSHTLNRCFYYCPPDDQSLLPDLEIALRVSSLRAFPTLETPINVGDVLPRLFVSDMCKKFLTKPVNAVNVHPSALNFPGFTEADAGAAKIIVRFDPNVTRWQGTGLYAPPGEVVTVEVPTNLLHLKLRLRIGCHSDKIWEMDDWTRYPELCREFPVTDYSSEIGIAFGGPIFAIIPPGAIPPSTNPPPVIQMRIGGALRQPYFIRGLTKTETWAESGMRAPAPWSEFGSQRIVFNLQSKLVRGIGKPNQFMQAWDGIVDAMRALTASTNRTYAERIVADQQPAGGKAHSGYPVVIPLGRSEEILNLRNLADGTSFDILTLLGENHIPPAFNTDDLRPALGSLIALYSVENFIGKKMEDYLPDLSTEKRPDRITGYFNNGPDLKRLKDEPIYGTVFFSQLAREIGWDALRAAFAAAAALPAAAQPQSDDQRRDLLVVLLSIHAQKNLAPHFKRWGIPVGDAATAKVASLPAFTLTETALPTL